MYMRKNVNISLEPKVYQAAKKFVPKGEISPFINNVLKEYVKKQKEQELKKAYQRTARSKAMREEDKVLEGSVEDGIDE